MNIFHLQEKKFKKKGELLNLDLQWKNTPYAKIRVSLAACDQELTFFGPPVISLVFFGYDTLITIPRW